MYPLVKSKCYGVDGQRTCQRVGHSCMRKVINNAGFPFAGGWQLVGRALRGIAQWSAAGWEVFGLMEVRTAIDSMLAQLPPRCSRLCQDCSCLLPEHVTIVTADIDQAYESADSSTALADLELCLQAYERRHGTRAVLVKRGKRDFTRPPRTKGIPLVSLAWRRRSYSRRSLRTCRSAWWWSPRLSSRCRACQ